MSPELARNSMADLGDVWPPGFRFHPTDEELTLYYLKRKICHRKLRLDVIAEVDVYKWDPEDLPALSLVNNGDRQWFFFSPRDKKYPNGSRANRATEHGYWKATGKDRTISCNSRTVGLKKTLVFYKGRASGGERTDWVMHEYTLEESELRRCQDVQDYYVLYKVFKKSGPGPKNGEHYGAPFKEEDWVDDELPAVSNCDDLNNNVKQSNGIASVDMHNDKTQEQCTWDDIEVLLNLFVDSPPEGPDINDYQCTIPQVLGEEAHTTMPDPSVGKTTYVDSCRMQPLQGQQNVDGSTNFSLLSTSQGKLLDASKVASTGLTNLEQYLLDEDFLEMDDLLGPDATDDVGGFIPQPACGEPTIDSQWGEVNGLSELDLCFDLETFLHDLRPINQATTPHSFLDHQATQLVNLDDVEGKQPSNAMNIGIQQGTYDQNCFSPTLEESNQETTSLPTTGDVCAGNFTPKAMESIPNRSGKGVEGNDKWYSSAIWSFVESIPTTPASASESALVNRAFERMSSFTRLRIIPKSTTGGSTGGRMKGFFLFPSIRAFFAVLFVLISSFGKMRYLFNILHN